jgi:hypothetical protein
VGKIFRQPYYHPFIIGASYYFGPNNGAVPQTVYFLLGKVDGVVKPAQRQHKDQCRNCD